MKTIKQQREEKHERYSAIDRHNDFVEQGYQTKRKAPFIGRVAEVVLTPLAKKIIQKDSTGNDQTR